MPSRQSWKNTRTFRYEIEGVRHERVEIIKSGTFQAKSVKEARTKSRQITQKLGFTWGKKWNRGWIQDAIEGTQGWLGNNDHEPTKLLWIYVPKKESLHATTPDVSLPQDGNIGNQHPTQ